MIIREVLVLIILLLLSKVMSSIVLYALDVSNYCSSVKIALLYKGLDHVIIPPPSGYGSAEYKRIIPMGTIPAIVYEEVPISESQVILEYLDDKFPDTKRLFLKDPEMNAMVRMVHRLHDLYLEPQIRALFKHMDPKVRDNDFVKEKFDLFNSRLIQLENIVSDEGPYFLGDFTVADCVLPPTLIMTEMMAKELGQQVGYDDHIKLKNWWKRIKDDKCVSAVLEKAAVATQEWIDRKKNTGEISKCSL